MSDLRKALLILLVVVTFDTAEPMNTSMKDGDCLPNVPVYHCVADPCEVTECPLYPNAQCVSNFCGGCNADFFVDEKLVDCTEKRGKCPNLKPPSDLSLVRCGLFCAGDVDCDGELKCCYDGCSSWCLQPIGVPPYKDCNGPGGHHEHGETYPAGDGCNECTCNNGDEACTEKTCLEKLGQCPAVGTDVGICAELCSTDASCDGAEKCCSNGCGHTCQEPIPGADCNGHPDGSTYPSDDGCNTCSCSDGREMCTLIACAPLE
ncbi:kielin/chordin-like protein [Saccoglossus kowalevskii]|uniref:Kielin/chordin-like protein-like n=1 Tax=Saccoglossus kowalevskii TaxID=10224 RepID=A0ABM0GPQ6_SACKO|nr:PREDICTED: kielin/chordin-like protein-like [Saccoglossus kowalevskii]